MVMFNKKNACFHIGKRAFIVQRYAFFVILSHFLSFFQENHGDFSEIITRSLTNLKGEFLLFADYQYVAIMCPFSYMKTSGNTLCIRVLT